MKRLSETHFEIQILSHVRISAEVCRFKIVLKKKEKLYLLRNDHAKMKTFTAPFFRSFNLLSVSDDLRMLK